MNETTKTTFPTAKRHSDRRLRASAEPAPAIGELTYMVLITVAAALLTGLLALPFTMPGGAYAGSPTAFGAADAGPLAGAPPASA